MYLEKNGCLSEEKNWYLLRLLKFLNLKLLFVSDAGNIFFLYQIDNQVIADVQMINVTIVYSCKVHCSKCSVMFKAAINFRNCIL